MQRTNVETVVTKKDLEERRGRERERKGKGNEDHIKEWDRRDRRQRQAGGFLAAGTRID